MKRQTHIQMANVATQAHKKPVRIAKVIPAGGTDTIPYMIPADCTLENVYARFYGSMHLLQVEILHEQRGTGIANSVIDFLGDRAYLSGDFEEIDEPVTRAMRYKDYIIVRVNNTDTKENTVNVVLSLDFYGGQSRVIGG